MYKKLTCAFCLVISIFIVSVIIYLVLTETGAFTDKPPKIKVPKLSLYLVNATGYEEPLHEISNSEYILNFNEYKLDSSQAIPNYEGGLTSASAGRTRLLLRCHSNYPAQLIYSGFGNVTEVRNRNRREMYDIQDRFSYKFITELEFLKVDESITGKYVCQIRSDQNDLVASSFMYIYAAGPKTFVSHSNRELIAEPGTLIEIPCPVSHPEKAPRLISVIQLIEDTTFEREVELEQIHTFDPRTGFILHPDNFGSYTCRDDKNFEVSGRITVYMPLKNIVKGRSLRVYSQNVKNTSNALKLECRAREPVEFKFFNFIKFSRQPREVKTEDVDYPYSVRIKIDKKWFRGNVSVVECITKQDRRVVKTWKFLKHDLGIVQEDFLVPKVHKYLHHVKDQGYECCSSQSNLRPILRNYPCNTPTECELRKPCLSLDPLRTSQLNGAESCPYLKSANEAIYEGNEGCTMLKLSGNSSGVIRCSVDSDMVDFAYFTGQDMEGMYSSMPLMSLSRKRVEPSAVLKLSKMYKSPATSFQRGGVIRFECQGPKLLFASGFQWAAVRNDEDINYLRNKGARVENDSPLHIEFIDVTFDINARRRLYCFAPLINPSLYGQQWMNVSVTF